MAENRDATLYEVIALGPVLQVVLEGAPPPGVGPLHRRDRRLVDRRLLGKLRIKLRVGHGGLLRWTLPSSLGMLVFGFGAAGVRGGMLLAEV